LTDPARTSQSGPAPPVFPQAFAQKNCTRTLLRSCMGLLSGAQAHPHGWMKSVNGARRDSGGSLKRRRFAGHDRAAGAESPPDFKRVKFKLQQLPSRTNREFHLAPLVDRGVMRARSIGCADAYGIREAGLIAFFAWIWP